MHSAVYHTGRIAISLLPFAPGYTVQTYFGVLVLFQRAVVRGLKRRRVSCLVIECHVRARLHEGSLERTSLFRADSDTLDTPPRTGQAQLEVGRLVLILRRRHGR